MRKIYAQIGQTQFFEERICPLNMCGSGLAKTYPIYNYFANNRSRPWHPVKRECLIIHALRLQPYGTRLSCHIWGGLFFRYIHCTQPRGLASVRKQGVQRDGRLADSRQTLSWRRKPLRGAKLTGNSSGTDAYTAFSVLRAMLPSRHMHHIMPRIYHNVCYLTVIHFAARKTP